MLFTFAPSYGPTGTHASACIDALHWMYMPLTRSIAWPFEHALDGILEVLT